MQTSNSKLSTVELLSSKTLFSYDQWNSLYMKIQTIPTTLNHKRSNPSNHFKTIYLKLSELLMTF